MEMFRRTYAEINLKNLAHNIGVLQTAFPDRFLCPMIKANAYGHGDVEFARHLEKIGVKHLGVCLIEEGLALRKGGVQAEILVFRGFDREGAEQLVKSKLTPVVSSWEQLQYLEDVAHSSVDIHVKIDTGMNRLGFRPEEAQKLYDRLWQNKKIRVKALVTHLFNGEDAISTDGVSARQLRLLHKVHDVFKPFNIFCHALNSSGALSLLHLQKTGVTKDHPLMMEKWGLRPGLMIYGYNPISEHAQFDLKPVMTLKSSVGSFRAVKAGETVSYGGTWTAPRDSVIAVVLIGYADGYHRILSNQSVALFNGKKVSLVGTVCMDYLMLDVTDAVQGQDLNKLIDQEVVLFGTAQDGTFLSADELAKKAKSIPWEMLTSVGERVPRIYVGGV